MQVKLQTKRSLAVGNRQSIPTGQSQEGSRSLNQDSRSIMVIFDIAVDIPR